MDTITSYLQFIGIAQPAILTKKIGGYMYATIGAVLWVTNEFCPLTHLRIAYQYYPYSGKYLPIRVKPDEWRYMQSEKTNENTTNQRGSGLIEFAFGLLLVVLIVYLALSWSMGTCDISQWAHIMETSNDATIHGIAEILHRLGFLNSVLS